MAGYNCAPASAPEKQLPLATGMRASGESTCMTDAAASPDDVTGTNSTKGIRYDYS